MEQLPLGLDPPPPQPREPWLFTRAGRWTVWILLGCTITGLGIELLLLTREPVQRGQAVTPPAAEPDAPDLPDQQRYEPLSELAYQTFTFGEGYLYEVELPQDGRAVNIADSDWPDDPRVALVWHWDDGPLSDAVFRVTPLASADPAEYDAWLQEMLESLRSDLATKPEGDLSSFGSGGRVWRNLPLSRYAGPETGRQAADYNFAQFGADAVTATFYFPLPAEGGVVDRVLPRILGSLRLAPGQEEEQFLPPGPVGGEGDGEPDGGGEFAP